MGMVYIQSQTTETEQTYRGISSDVTKVRDKWIAGQKVRTLLMTFFVRHALALANSLVFAVLLVLCQYGETLCIIQVHKSLEESDSRETDKFLRFPTAKDTLQRKAWV